jgi:hypothetical protein
MRLAVSTQETLSLETRLLDRADRRYILGRRLGIDPLEAELEHRPPSGKPKGSRTHSSPARLREHRNRDASDFLVVELDVDESQGDVGRRVGDDERCRSS